MNKILKKSISELMLPFDCSEELDSSQELILSENTTQEESKKLIDQHQTESHLKISNCSEITTIDLSKWTNLTVLKIQKSENLAKITGLEKCINLEILFISNTKITELDVSKCSLLKTISIDGTGITKFDVSKCHSLTFLNLWENSELTQITGLDACINLETLIIDKTAIVQLDVTQCSSLIELYAYDCKQLTTINGLKACINLKKLLAKGCSPALIKELDNFLLACPKTR